MRNMFDLDARRLSWRERHVCDWIDKLPTADPVRALALLAQSVRALNSGVMDAATRVSLLGHYQQSVMGLVGAVRKPHADEAGRELAIMLHSEIAHGYQMALTAELRLEFRQRAVLGALCQLGEVMCAAYRSYIPAPPGLWRRIHNLYRDAGVVTEAIERAYVEILLLGFSDPYALPAGDIVRVRRIIHEVGHYATLGAGAGFAIATDADRVGDTRVDEGALSLDTTALLQEMERIRAALHTRNTLPKGLSLFLLPDVADRLLVRLMETWRPGPRRRSLRIRLSGERLVCHGLPALQRLASFGSDPRLFADFDNEGGGVMRLKGAPSVKLPRISSWSVRDAGQSGLWLSTRGATHPLPAPGSWIGIQDPQRDGSWHAAAVRWLKRSRPHEYAIGVEVLGEAQTAMILKAEPPTALFVKASRAAHDRTPRASSRLVVTRHPSGVQRDAILQGAGRLAGGS